MQHIDELFLWLAQTMVQSFKVQVAEMWAVQAGPTGKLSVYLRTLVREDTTLPPYPVANEHVAALVGNLLSNRNDYTLWAVGEIFSSHQSSLLRRYGLNFCTSHFVSSSMLLPGASTRSSAEGIPTPLMATMLLFLQQPLPAHTLAALHQMTEQAVIVAESRGLLLAPSTTSDRLPAVSTLTALQQTGITPAQLIPHRSEDARLLMSSNPLNGSVVITDKAARRLYAAIDGHRNMDELRQSTGMEMKEAFLALQILWEQQRIQLYNVEGQSVDGSQFFANS